MFLLTRQIADEGDIPQSVTAMRRCDEHVVYGIGQGVSCLTASRQEGDAWSAGVLLYQLATVNPAFHGLCDPSPARTKQQTAALCKALLDQLFAWQVRSLACCPSCSQGPGQPAILCLPAPLVLVSTTWVLQVCPSLEACHGPCQAS